MWNIFEKIGIKTSGISFERARDQKTNNSMEGLNRAFQMGMGCARQLLTISLNLFDENKA